MTPREFWGAVKGHLKSERRALALTVTGAWMGEGFARTKRLPPLEKVLKNLEGEKARSTTPMTAAKARDMARALHAMFGAPDKAPDEDKPNPAKKPPRPRRPRKPKKPEGE